MKRLLAASLLLCVSSLSVIAATPPNALVVAQSLDDVTSLDPAQGFELTSVQTFTNVYQRLVQADPKKPTVLEPTLASSWTSTPKSLTLTLRKDAQFASGNPIRPEDVVFSLGRVVKLNLAPSFILTQLGWDKDNVDSHIQKLADNKIKISWDVNVGPSFVLSLLSAPAASIVDEKIVMANAENGDLGHAWLNNHSAGSGPFQIKQYTPHEALVLTANKTSPGGAPKLKLILMKNVPDAATRQLLIEQGDADIARNLGADQFQSLKDKEGVTTLALPYASLYYILFNTDAKNNPDLANPKFWEAAHWAFDYKGIGVDLMRGQFQVQQSFLPQGFKGALKDQPYHYDPEKAKAILKKAGIKNPHFKLIVSNQPPYLDVAQALQASFSRAGIKVELIPGLSSQVSSDVNTHNFEATVSAWGPDYFDPNTNASAFAYNPENGSKTLAWRANWHIPELSKMTIAARAETNEAKRIQMYETLQRKVRENSPIVVGLQNKKLVAIRSDLKGYVQGIMPDMVYYKNVSK